MADGLDVIIVDDDPSVCETLSEIITGFYAWGEVLGFTDVDDADATNFDGDSVTVTTLEYDREEGTDSDTLDSEYGVEEQWMTVYPDAENLYRI